MQETHDGKNIDQAQLFNRLSDTVAIVEEPFDRFRVVCLVIKLEGRAEFLRALDFVFPERRQN